MLKDTLLKLANRGTTLNGYDVIDGQRVQVDVDARNRDFLRTLASSPISLLASPDDTEDMRLAKADALTLLTKVYRDRDVEAGRTLQAIRLEQVNNFVMAESTFMSFFQVVTLADNEQPYVQNETRNEIKVGYLSQEGTPRMLKIERPTAEAAIELRELASEKVWYKTRDIYKGGRIADLAKATFDIARDLRIKEDNECKRLLGLAVGSGGAYGTFTFSGAKVSRIYVPHSNIDTSHFPTTNDLTVKRRKASDIGQVVWLDTNNAAVANEGLAVVNGFFGIAVLQDIIRYCDSWGDIFSDGRLRPTGEIIVPAKDVFDILFGLGQVGVNVNESQMQKDIQDKGYTGFNLYGVNWKFIPDSTIASGTCYPKLNKTPGRVFLKPTQDEEFTDLDREKSIEYRWVKKVFGMHIINQHRLNAIRLTYK